MIKRSELVRRHNPVLNKIDKDSPLTVGNGEFAFTADVTGFQTLYDEYDVFPLCTMSQWGWHTEPAGDRLFTLDDVVPTIYTVGDRNYKYFSERHQGNEHVYDWLRHNPHRLNLARITLLWNGDEVKPDEVTDINQELDLYSGVISSEFRLYGVRVSVRTVCAYNADSVGFSIESPALGRELSVGISFPYGSHLISASDWQNEDRHNTYISRCYDGRVVLKRRLDSDEYAIIMVGVDSFRFFGINSFELFFDKGRGIKGQFTCTFSTKNLSSPCPQPFPYPSFSCSPFSCPDFDWVLSDSANGWKHFWQDGGAVDFSGASDHRAKELERRAVLSQYLINAQCTGSLPPQETGLSCNSWYGKFHLEMHILHSGWLPLWGHSKRLERSLPFYKSILGKAKENAARNGFIGARWPKMIGPDGIDSPSWIATLLIWQQPHILYFLELMRKARSTNELQQRSFMEDNWELVYETALFMFDFPQLNRVSGRFDLTAPIIPAQEEFAPESVHNPVFELCYWMFGLDIAINWAKELGKARSVYGKWEDVRSSLATVPVQNGLFPAHGLFPTHGLYPAHQNCSDTFTKYNKDHPSMLYAYGFIPCDKIDKSTMSATVDKVLKCWDKGTLWGWDFALIAMTLTRLGRPEDAIDILLADTAKNSYTVSGNNFQRGRSDLPLYLPGNGSLLLALAMMLAGYGRIQGKVGFPKNKQWDDIIVEGIGALPY